MTDVPDQLLQDMLKRRRAAVAQLVSLLEDTRVAVFERRDQVLTALESAAARRGHQGRVVGVTGTPGSGKSSLIASLVREILTADHQVTLAVVAVDPSSQVSHGSLLGDRTRFGDNLGGRSDDRDRIFFRSQAAVTALGGLAPSSYLVTRGLATIFDLVLVETVGIGQSETDIRALADEVCLVMSPGAGDDVQLLKAGVIEIPDRFVVNKSDLPGAEITYHQLRSNLWLARPFDAERLAIHRTSAVSGEGVTGLAEALLHSTRHLSGPGPQSAKSERAQHFFRAWVRDEWGRQGEAFARSLPGPVAADASFGEAQRRFTAEFRRSLSTEQE